MVGTLEERARENDEKRKEAISSRNARLYFQLCNESGITPEDQNLYERGYLAQEKLQNKSVQVSRQKTNSENYVGFVREARSLGVPLSWSKWTTTKRELLEKYFPGRFNQDKQDLRDYMPAQIGRVFDNLLKYAKKRI